MCIEHNYYTYPFACDCCLVKREVEEDRKCLIVDKALPREKNHVTRAEAHFWGPTDVCWACWEVMRRMEQAREIDILSKYYLLLSNSIEAIVWSYGSMD